MGRRYLVLFMAIILGFPAIAIVGSASGVGPQDLKCYDKNTARIWGTHAAAAYGVNQYRFVKNPTMSCKNIANYAGGAFLLTSIGGGVPFKITTSAAPTIAAELRYTVSLKVTALVQYKSSTGKWTTIKSFSPSAALALANQLSPAAPATTTTKKPVPTTVKATTTTKKPVTTTTIKTLTPNVDSTGVTDVSDKMASFFANVPDGSIIDLKTNGRYRMEKTLQLFRKKNLTIRGNGATFFATTTGDSSRSHVNLFESSHIYISNLHILGANPMAGAKDRVFHVEYEGQHGFKMNSASFITLVNCSVADVYGDFIYMAGNAAPPTTDVLIQNFTGLRSGRQGITLVGNKNITIENSRIYEAKRSSIDMEPWGGTGAVIDNVIIRNNSFSKGGLTFISAAGVGATNNITVQGNKLYDMTLGVDVRDLSGARRSNWKILNNVADLPCGNPMGGCLRFERIDGLTVTGNTQPMKPLRNMFLVLASSSTGLNVSGNSVPNGAGQLITVRQDQ